ncbi:uncharacterized protein LOC141715094 [Apium graveolens]|uniref:uncharacterized protein LOC141715094 n=1 Tax=Apium graveolens TaxID=4045 RepID=UPI003D7B7C8E
MAYACYDCKFDVCLECAFVERELSHPGHLEHTLTLMQRPALKRISATKWLYYCHLCTYFVHMGCAALPDESSTVNEIEADGTDNEPDLVQFPLPREELIFDFIVTQSGKLQGHFQGELGGSITRSTLPLEVRVIEEHWSHKNHPLEQLEFTFSDNDDDHNDDNRKVFRCDGCILPITASNPSYYACTECSFFLHSFCATRLPRELPSGASPFHPQHPLHLYKTKTFYSFVECRACNLSTNGFFYQCETCEMEIDIRCAFFYQYGFD